MNYPFNGQIGLLEQPLGAVEAAAGDFLRDGTIVCPEFSFQREATDTPRGRDIMNGEGKLTVSPDIILRDSYEIVLSRGSTANRGGERGFRLRVDDEVE